MLTTKSVGIGEETANPKPVRAVNWCGLPMKEGESYWGVEPQQDAVVPDAPKSPRVKRVKRSWTAEQLEALRARMAHARVVQKAKREAALLAAEQKTQDQGQEKNQQQ